MRDLLGLEAVVGCFINFLPVRLMQPKQTDVFTAIRGTQLAIADAIGHGNVPIQDIVKSLPRSTFGSMRNGVALYQTMLQLIDDPAAAPLVFQKREPVESDLSGLLLRISLLPTAEDAIEGVLNFPSNLLEPARAGVLVQSFQRSVSLVVRSPESPVDELAASVIKATCLKEQGSSVPPDVTRALNRHEYAYLKDLGKTRTTDLWSPRAASGLHWHNTDHSAWLSHTNGCWEGWDDASGIPCSLAIEWQPWDSVCDDVALAETRTRRTLYPTRAITDSVVRVRCDRTPRPSCDGLSAPTRAQLSTSSTGTCSLATLVRRHSCASPMMTSSCPLA